MTRLLLMAMCLGALSCADDLLVPRSKVSGPYLTHDSLVYIDENRSAVVWVSPEGKAGPAADKLVHRIALDSKPTGVRVAPVPGKPQEKQVLLLDPANERLLLIASSGAVQPVAVGIPLGALDITDDGRYAVGYEPEGAEPSRSLFAFPNSVAVLDLQRGAAPTVLRLGSSGARPLKVVFSEALRLLEPGLTQNSVTLRLALVFARGGLVPVDLQNAKAAALVPLSIEANRDILPAEVLFTNNRGDDIRGLVDSLENAFVRTTAGELFVLAIALSPEDKSLSVVLENVVTPDVFVHDIELFFDDEGNSLLLAAAKDELVLVNGYTGIARRVAVDHPVDTLVSYIDPESGAPRALAYSAAQPNDVVYRVDPQGLLERRASGLRAIQLGNRVRRIDIKAAAPRAVLFYNDARELGVLNLAGNLEALDIRFARSPQGSALSDDGASLLLVSTSPEDERPYLARIDLHDDLATESVLLDQHATHVGALGNFLWVHHHTANIDVTLFPQQTLNRFAGIALRNIMLVDIFEQLPQRPTP